MLEYIFLNILVPIFIGLVLLLIEYWFFNNKKK